VVSPRCARSAVRPPPAGSRPVDGTGRAPAGAPSRAPRRAHRRGRGRGIGEERAAASSAARAAGRPPRRSRPRTGARAAGGVAPGAAKVVALPVLCRVDDVQPGYCFPVSESAGKGDRHDELGGLSISESVGPDSARDQLWCEASGRGSRRAQGRDCRTAVARCALPKRANRLSIARSRRGGCSPRVGCADVQQRLRDHNDVKEWM